MFVGKCDMMSAIVCGCSSTMKVRMFSAPVLCRKPNGTEFIELRTFSRISPAPSVPSDCFSRSLANSMPPRSIGTRSRTMPAKLAEHGLDLVLGDVVDLGDLERHRFDQPLGSWLNTSAAIGFSRVSNKMAALRTASMRWGEFWG